MFNLRIEARSARKAEIIVEPVSTRHVVEEPLILQLKRGPLSSIGCELLLAHCQTPGGRYNLHSKEQRNS